jgi:hypothetical protein
MAFDNESFDADYAITTSSPKHVQNPGKVIDSLGRVCWEGRKTCLCDLLVYVTNLLKYQGKERSLPSCVDRYPYLLWVTLGYLHRYPYPYSPKPLPEGTGMEPMLVTCGLGYLPTPCGLRVMGMHYVVYIW